MCAKRVQFVLCFQRISYKINSCNFKYPRRNKWPMGKRCQRFPNLSSHVQASSLPSCLRFPLHNVIFFLVYQSSNWKHRDNHTNRHSLLILHGKWVIHYSAYESFVENATNTTLDHKMKHPYNCHRKCIRPMFP